MKTKVPDGMLAAVKRLTTRVKEIEVQEESSSHVLPTSDLRPAALFWAAAGLPEQLRPQFRISEEDVLAFRASQSTDADSQSKLDSVWTSEERLEAALRWLSESPIVPTMDDVEAMQEAYCGQQMSGEPNVCRFIATEWQRRMFAAPEPGSPYDAVLDAALKAAPLHVDGVMIYSSNGDLLAEARRRGQKAEANAK